MINTTLRQAEKSILKMDNDYRISIETERLLLRTVTLEDIDEVAASWKLDGGLISPEEAESKIHWMMANHKQNAPGRLVHLCLAIVDKHSQEIIGWCGLDHRDPTKANPVLFYLLKERCWGRGLATEAARAVLGYAFGTLGLPRIDSAAAFENTASKRVMEKLGMRYLGLDEAGGHAFTMTMEPIEFNKQAAVKFLELIVARRIDEAYDSYVDMSGTHHNPYYPPTMPALRQGMIDNDAQIPNKQLIVKHVLAEGNLVAVHSHLILDPYEMSVVHLFRFQGQKIVEIWDIGMPIPADAPNRDGVF